jgi:hypothetical protein
VCTKWQRFNGQLPGVVLFAPISFHHPSRLSPQHSCPSIAIALPTHQQPQNITLLSVGQKGSLAVKQLSPPTTDCSDEYDRYVLLTPTNCDRSCCWRGGRMPNPPSHPAGARYFKLESVTIRSLSTVVWRPPCRFDHDRPDRRRSETPPSSLLWFCMVVVVFSCVRAGPAVPRNLHFPPCRAGKLVWR